ncbi:MAG: glycerol-3-phosphate dehydrogenase/oxidase [Bacteroidia bacterium]|nr:glycerol-3-phosphate dehydrogenase/oxidase [Bacteroidia bacterium]MDW8089033.1 glycerol-3-phosphate dehydrogenase/oxidase [Bacteroidia bacterium]
MPKLLIIGAGSSGLGVALAAARRGWQVIVYEAKDIGSGTSTTSTKLIHGGLRYLERAIRHLRWADWKLVREALAERAWMLQSHPQLCRPISIVLPIGNLWEKSYYGLGLYLYHWLSRPYQLAPPKWVPAAQLRPLFPTLSPPLQGGWRYYDGQFQDRLYLVHLALFLRQRFGVDIRPYHKVTAIYTRPSYVGVRVETAEGHSYEEAGDFVVNAAGPWADLIRQQVYPEALPRLRLSRGSHLVFARADLPLAEGFLIPRTRDGRLLFALPWLEETVLVGTTDIEVEAPTWEVSVAEAEEAYLRTHLAYYFPEAREAPILARFAGLRPLVSGGSHSTAQLSREHVVEVWPEKRFASLMGGKWTTYRVMGEAALREVCRALRMPFTRGESVEEITPDLSQLRQLQEAYPTPIVEGEPFTEGEVRFWRRLGWAQRPEDLVAGRWQLAFIHSERAAKVRAVLQAKWEQLI